MNKNKDEELDEIKPYRDEEVEKMLHESIGDGRCIRCGTKIDLFTCSWDDGNPVCRGGCRSF